MFLTGLEGRFESSYFTLPRTAPEILINSWYGMQLGIKLENSLLAMLAIIFCIKSQMRNRSATEQDVPGLEQHRKP